MNKFVFGAVMVDQSAIGAVIFKVDMVRNGNFGSDFFLKCHFLPLFMLSKVKNFKFFVLKPSAVLW